VSQQMQGPVAVAYRRLSQPQSNQLCFRLTVQLARRGRFRAFLALQGQGKTFRHQAFSEILEGLHAAVKRLSNPHVWPCWPIGVSFEQHLRTTKFLRGALEMLDDLLTPTTLVIREPYNELLMHGKPPCPQKLPSKPLNQQPQFLVLKRH